MLNWSVYFYFNTLSCQNYFFQRVGGVKNSSGNSGEVEVYFSGQKVEIPERRGGLRVIPSMVGRRGVWIFSGTTCWAFVVPF